MLLNIFKKKSGFGETIEDANKLIFVKKYQEAFELLTHLSGKPGAFQNIILQLRRIELAHKLGVLTVLEKKYENRLAQITDPNEAKFIKLSLIFCVQQKEDSQSADVIDEFQQFLSDNGESAAAYYGIGYALECLGNYDRAIYNYNLSVNLDPDFYPSYFGLSQVFYLKQNEVKGDHYFYLYERAAPYNLYGNFETHKQLCNEFLAAEHFDEAMAAIKTLSDWWVENKGHLPDEIKVFQNYAFAEIAEIQGDQAVAYEQKEKAQVIIDEILAKEEAKDSTLYFIAKTLEDYDNFEQAYRFYVKILKSDGDSALIQKIGSQFFSVGEFETAFKMFNEAYEDNPDNIDVRFCKLVADLKLKKVNVEEYLLSKEKMRRLVRADNDRVELLTLLHSLLANYSEDPEVHAEMGEVYLNLGNKKRAKSHYEKMMEIDPKGIHSKIRYAEYTIQNDDPELGFKEIQAIDPDYLASKGYLTHCKWLKATYYSAKGDIGQSISLSRSLLQVDPWNVSYLIHITKAMMLDYKDKLVHTDDDLLTDLLANRESGLDWDRFDKVTEKTQKHSLLELAYFRAKIRFLYGEGRVTQIAALVKIAKEYDPDQGVKDFLRLLNTNFDSAHVLLALGLLCKEQWRLETAIFWFEQVVNKGERLPKVLMSKAFLELADSYLWANYDANKAIEYAKIAVDLSQSSNPSTALLVLGHAYLKSGHAQEAKMYLDQVSGKNKEKDYLLGLLAMRDGDLKEAKKSWENLIGITEDTRKLHEMRKNVHGFLYEQKSYISAS